MIHEELKLVYVMGRSGDSAADFHPQLPRKELEAVITEELSWSHTPPEQSTH